VANGISAKSIPEFPLGLGFAKISEPRALVAWPAERPMETFLAMSRSVSMPLGSWPLEIRAETAAAYCDEPSVEAFHRKVQLGIYSPPSRQIGCLPKWHRFKLDRDIARRHGLQMPGPQLAEDAADLI
jgi:hypothetical protein